MTRFPNPGLINTPEYLSWRRMTVAKSSLTNVTEMSVLMAEFAVAATVELNIGDSVNSSVLMAHVIATSLLVSTCMIANVICTYILPYIECVAKGKNISGANESPHDKMRQWIHVSWILTTYLSIFFFILDVILLCWIKSAEFTPASAKAATVIMTPVLIIILVVAFFVYRRTVQHQYLVSSKKYEELEKLYEQLEQTYLASTPSTPSYRSYQIYQAPYKI